LAGERAVSVALDLFVTFLWVGSLAFGGGFGMVPLLRQAVLAHHWLTIGPFDQAIAMGQITPGPVAISATFIGERVGSRPRTWCIEPSRGGPRGGVGGAAATV